jgi:hypothetical protein
MSDVSAALHEAVTEEPPLGFGAAEVVARARRTRRKRRALSLGGTAVVAAAAVTGVMLAGTSPAQAPSAGGAAASGASASGTHAVKLTLTALGQIARRHPKQSLSPDEKLARTAVVEGIKGPELAGLIEQETGVQLTGVSVSALGRPSARQSGELDLAAGLAVPGHPYLNVQVAPAHNLITTKPTCAELSDLASGSGDGYYGPCQISTLPDGSLLIVRSGTTTSHGYTMAQAVLIRPDGSGVFAENTNQSWINPATEKQKMVAIKKGAAPAPNVRRLPVLSAAAMQKLVESLAAQASS